MHSIEHPDSEQLTAYLESPEQAKRQATGLHLASCMQCRSDLQALSSLRQHGPWIGLGSIKTGATESSDLIPDLVHGRLSEPAAEELRNSIKNDPELLREALHYARHHVAMQKDVEAPQISISEDSFWHKTKQLVLRFLQIETPVWKLAPVAIVLIAVVAIFSGVWNQHQAMQVADIIKFEDQSTIQFVSQEQQPGIGFFANSKQMDMPFDGVSLHLETDRKLDFSWPAIDGATHYRLKLQVFRDGETVVLGRVSSNEPAATMILPEALTQHRYKWILSGDTSDGQSFQTTGGFVVKR